MSFRKIVRALLSAILTATPLAGCTVSQDARRDPVTTAAVVALIPVMIPVGVVVAAIKIADGPSAPRRYPPNELPLYGEQPKTQAMLEADQRLIAAALETGLSRAQASDKSVQLGWQYFQQRRDIATAMKRFNQAWLLDPENGDAFHGFAVLVMARDHAPLEAGTLFRRGIAAPRQSAGIWLDYGRFLVMTNKPAEAVAPLRMALSFADMGPDAGALLTLALARSGDLPAACAEKARIRDGAQKVIGDAARAIACEP
jgi:hypothetical protein